MHLWPSFRLRDSFKWDYLKNLDRNLQRMKSDRQRRQRLNTSASSSSPSPHPKPDNSSSFLLLPSDVGDDTPQVQSDADKADGPPIPTTNWILILLSELFLILSCCYCCFCCGACGDEASK